MLERFRGHIAPGDPGAPRGDHHIDRGIDNPGAQQGFDQAGVVFLDRARGDAVAGFDDAVGERVAGGVVGGGARVRHRQHRDVDREEGAGLVEACHGRAFAAAARSLRQTGTGVKRSEYIPNLPPRQTGA